MSTDIGGGEMCPECDCELLLVVTAASSLAYVECDCGRAEVLLGADLLSPAA